MPSSVKSLLPHEKNLLNWNYSMFVLHAVQGFIALGFSLGAEKAKNFKIPLITNFVEWVEDPTDQQNYPEVIQET